MVAFKKLKTPTAVAEFLIECYDTIRNEIASLQYDFSNLILQKLTTETDSLSSIAQVFQTNFKEQHRQCTISAIEIGTYNKTGYF